MNSEKDLVKEAYAAAEKERREKQVSEVKKIVTKTLEKLDTVKKEIKAKQEEERLLKMDIDDLKEGRLDRISERQEKDPEAKKVSVVLIIKEKEIIREKEYVPYPSPYYWPYTVVWQTPYIPAITTNTVYCGGASSNTALIGECTSINNTGNATSISVGSANCQLSDGSQFQATVTPTCINGSVAKFATVGSYDVNGHIINLR